MGKRLALHQKGIECYQNRDYNEATRIFKGLRDADRSDELYPALLKLISGRET
jgi:hypothetical protein